MACVLPPAYWGPNLNLVVHRGHMLGLHTALKPCKHFIVGSSIEPKNVCSRLLMNIINSIFCILPYMSCLVPDWKLCGHFIMIANSSYLLSPLCLIYASVNWVNIGSDNGLSPERRPAIIWTNADVFLHYTPKGTYFNEVLFKIQIFSFKKMHLNMSTKWWQFCPGGDESMITEHLLK